MKFFNCVFLIFLIASIQACGGESKENKILHKAADLHMEAVQIKKEIEPKLEELKQLGNSIQIQGRALTQEEIDFSKAVNAIEGRLKYWNENHVEVPGFEHAGEDHESHNHEHNHDHGTQLNLPAPDILILQKELRDSIIRIQRSIEGLLVKAPK